MFLVLGLVSSFPFCVFFFEGKVRELLVSQRSRGSCRESAAGAPEAAWKGTSDGNKGCWKDPEVQATTLWKQEVR